jgi:hypothetical protein
MTDTTQAAPAPKKRSLFKRAAWQDSPKAEDDDDIFSHSKDFQNIVAQQNNAQAEKRREAEEGRKRKQADHTDRKRRKVSSDSDEPALPGNGSGGSERPMRTGLSPSTSHLQPNSLSARYETLAKSTSSLRPSTKDSVIIDLGESDDEYDDNNNSGTNPDFAGGHASLDYALRGVAMRPTRHVPDDGDDDVEEMLDPALAALAARARERAANKAQAATSLPATDGELIKAPVAQLFISPEIPDAKPLMVKVRIDSTLERTRQAWCKIQGYSPEMIRNVYFTWKSTRVYDSTTVKRLGINVDAKGNVSVEGDSNIYDDTNLPKIYVEAWTDELFQRHKKEQALEAAARKRAVEPPNIVEEKEPTPEPAPKVKKLRLIMKAKGKEDYKLSVKLVSQSTFDSLMGLYPQSCNLANVFLLTGDYLWPYRRRIQTVQGH